jgi:RNA polymerase sigma-70 factor, ECF subfamily
LRIKEVLDGKSSSFTFLVDEYKNMVFTVCFRILRHREDAEDAAQNSFIKAYNNLHSFSGKSKFSTWLYTIAYRTAISSSTLKKIDTVDEDYLLETADDSSFSASKKLEAKDQQIFVQKAIEELPEIDGVLISLFYLDDCSIHEITEITSLNESNVKVRLFRARKQLKLNLRGMLNEEMEVLKE